MSRASKTTFWSADAAVTPPTSIAGSALCLFRALAARFRAHRQRGRNDALGASGVVGVSRRRTWTATGSLGRHPPLSGRGGKALVVPHRPALAAERVMHIGEPVVMVVAASAAAAQDAAELVAVEYEALTPVTDAREALSAGAPQLWPEALGNLAIDWPGPAADAKANAGKSTRSFAAQDSSRGWR